jgi:hypothetical protein
LHGHRARGWRPARWNAPAFGRKLDQFSLWKKTVAIFKVLPPTKTAEADELVHFFTVQKESPHSERGDFNVVSSFDQALP